MLRKICILIFVLIFPVMAIAQNYGKIIGKVIDDKTKDALPGVNVIIEGTQLGAATDLEGKYVILQVLPGYYNIRADYMGYQSVRVEQLLVRANHIAYADFSLGPKVLEMEEVVVVAERPVVEKDITATVRSVTDQEMQNIPSTTVNDILQMQAGVVSRGDCTFVVEEQVK